MQLSFFTTEAKIPFQRDLKRTVCFFTGQLQNSAVDKSSLQCWVCQDQSLTVLGGMIFSGERGKEWSTHKTPILTQQGENQAELWDILWLYLHHLGGSKLCCKDLSTNFRIRLMWTCESATTQQFLQFYNFYNSTVSILQ